MTAATLLKGYECDDRLSAELRVARELDAAADKLRTSPQSFHHVRVRLIICAEILRLADEAWPRYETPAGS